VEVLENAPALGGFDGLVPVWQGDTLHQVRSRTQIYATGAIEQPLLFSGNDLPGVMLSGGALRLIALYAVRPGTRAVVATVDDRGLHAALALLDAGVEVTCVADLRPNGGSSSTGQLQRRNVKVLRGATVLEARGRGQVQSAIVGPPEAGDHSERTFGCDLLVVSGGSAPAASLITQAGGRTSYDGERGHFAVAELPSEVYAAGEVAGAGELESAELSGSVAGSEAALSLGFGDAAARELAGAHRESLERRPAWPAPTAVPPPVNSERKGKCFACLCEDVTTKDIHLSVEEGYDSIELSKRYTTTTMGPCQGRMCQLPAVRLMAKETGQSLEEVGTTTARPPWVTVPMGALAGRPFEPAKRSAIHARHRDLGGNIMWAGDWRRAYDYGDPRGEAVAVHEAAGLIDVSTLGKLIVSGPDAGELLDRLYPNRFSNLKPGRIRYGVMASDSGRIMDDGTVCRLDDDSFYVTTTSSGAGAVYEWFSWWLADWGLEVHLTDVTQGLGAVNLAGPRSREIMAKVTDLDCSPEAFTYLDGKRADVAGVPSLILRIGFVGEVGYEIHFPAAQGEHLWDALLEAGAEHGIRPFGLEPQRLLRLQKMHILVGQDTDSESHPFAAAMPWIVKLDKEQDFIGKWALEHYSEQPLETALVGFTLANGHVPTEGAAIMPEGESPMGQVTSARYSPQLDKVIGLAWVPAALAKDGASVTISDNGKRLAAEVITKPFYDPDGEVLRS
jgi:sarcosine oxidase subunit alpha